MRKVLSCAAILFAVATAACAETSNAQSHVQFAVAGEVGARAPRVIEPTPLNFDTWGSYRDPRMSTVGEIA